ncbi:MAG TPA: M48 family metalloprotease [Bryobacteraceae bacterium]|jgi:heat shock protein HtpX
MHDDQPSMADAKRFRRNRLNHILVIGLLVAALTPFCLALGYLIPSMLVRYSGGITHQIDPDSQAPDPYQIGGPSEAVREKAVAAVRAADRALVFKLMPFMTVLVAVGMGLVLWAMSSSTTANLLAQLGARPATDGFEADVARTLDQFAASSGVPPPKLYFIHCSFPSTFSARLDNSAAIVAVTSGAIELLESRELDALLAHELTHIVNYDSRLDALLASLAVITEYPFKMFSGKTSKEPYDPHRKGSLRRKLAFLDMLLSPVGLYFLVVSPLLNRLLRAVMVRSSEFTADRNAAALTGNAETLAYALGKIGGVTTALGKSSVSLLPEYFGLPQRIEHLMSLYPACSFDRLQQAIDAGKQFVNDRPGMGDNKPGLLNSDDHMAMVNQGDLMGKVYRVVTGEPVPVYDTAEARSFVRARLQPGALVVVFNTPGKMRQVNTAQEVFGYISRDAKLQAVPGVLPQEIYNPLTRAAAEASLARQQAPMPGADFVPQPAIAAHAAAAWGLTRPQLWIAIGFGTAVFAGTMILLFVFAGR